MAQQRYQAVEREFGTLREGVDDARRQWFMELERASQQVTTMRERVGNVERQLEVTHFVLQTRSRNPVYGMGIFIGFGAWNKPRVGLDNFCLATSEVGECFWSRDLLTLGESISVEHDGFAYTITPRYAVPIPLLHDHVGFDILRERLKAQ